MITMLLADYAPTVTTVLGALLGVAIGRRMRPKAPEPLRPICSCTHGYGMHEDGKACRVTDKRADHWDTIGREDGWVSEPCPCLRYDGPDPSIFGLSVTP